MEMPTACVRKCVEDKFCGISRSNKVMAIAPIMPSSFPYREGGEVVGLIIDRCIAKCNLQLYSESKLIQCKLYSYNPSAGITVMY